VTGAPNACSRDGKGRRLNRPRRCRSHHERHRPKWIVPEPPVYGPSPLLAAFDIEYYRTKLFEILRIPKEYLEPRDQTANEIKNRMGVA
jgi:hypothetical protein